MPLVLPGEVPGPLPATIVPTAASSFTFFFRPILRDLWGYWWLDLPVYGRRPSEDASFQEACSLLPPDGWVPPGVLLPRFRALPPRGLVRLLRLP